MSLRICPDHLWACTIPTELGIDDVLFHPAYRYVAENRVLKFSAGGRQRLFSFHAAEMEYPQDLDKIQRVREFVQTVAQAEKTLYVYPVAEPVTPPATAWARIQDDDETG